MRYHFVLNGYLKDRQKQIQEQMALKDKCLSGMEEGETYIYCRNEADAASLAVHHTEKAVLLTAQEYIPEVVLNELTKQMKPDELYIFGSDFSGTELAVRAAERVHGSSVTAVTGLSVESDKISTVKMVYANHMEAAFSMENGPFCVSLSKGMEKGKPADGPFAVCGSIACTEGGEYVVSSQYIPEESDKGLEDAQILVAGGRGVKSKENMEILERTARSLGGQVGVSRPAAMNAWEPMSQLVGVSGAMTAPEICITAGVSGAAAFYAGVEKSKFIAAINTDEKAPIMKMADVAIIDDFIPVLTELEKIVNNQ